MNSIRKYVAEFIGTFVLVLFACGTAVVVGCSSSQGTGYLLTALAFGLVIVAMAYSVGNVSGCHINPAVSIAMLVLKKLSITDFVGYIVAQFLGAIAGAGVLKLITDPMLKAAEAAGDPAEKIAGIKNLGSNGVYDTVGLSIVIEIILTFVFVFAIIGVTSKAKNSSVAGIVIGLSLTLVHILGIAFTGTSVNPARSFGPALFAGGDALCNVWVFILAPLVGGVIAALVYKFLDTEKE